MPVLLQTVSILDESGCIMRSGSLPTLQGREMLAFCEPKQRVDTF